MVSHCGAAGLKPVIEGLRTGACVLQWFAHLLGMQETWVRSSPSARRALFTFRVSRVGAETGSTDVRHPRISQGPCGAKMRACGLAEWLAHLLGMQETSAG